MGEIHDDANLEPKWHTQHRLLRIDHSCPITGSDMFASWARSPRKDNDGPANTPHTNPFEHLDGATLPPSARKTARKHTPDAMLGRPCRAGRSIGDSCLRGGRTATGWTPLRSGAPHRE